MSENKVVQLIQKATEPDIKAIEFVEKILDLCKEGKLKSVALVAIDEQQLPYVGIPDPTKNDIFVLMAGCYHLIQELDAKLKWGA